MIPFKTARFIASGLESEEFPMLKNDKGAFLPEIALIGKSNVGKSSLINALLGDKKLAKTSSTPGKTQRINFFIIDEKLLLVDLPGYGYAKAAKGDVSSWSESIENYLSSRKTLSHLLLLVDSRRFISAEDASMMAWTQEKNIPFSIVFTKTDKLTLSEREQLQNQARQTLGSTEFLLFSYRDPGAKLRLIQFINRKIPWV